MINFTLMKHQQRLIERCKDKDHFYIAHDMGSGKTCSALQILRYKCFKHNRLLRTLILPPLSVKINWKREIENFTKIHRDQVHVLKDTGKKREAQLQRIIFNPQTNNDDATAVIIVNYDALTTKGIVELLHSWKPEMIICDEAHLVKNPKSTRSKEVMKLADQARYKLLLSGTPIANSELDFFMPFRIMDGGETFGKNYFQFRGNWFLGYKPIKTARGLEYTKFQLNPSRRDEFFKLLYSKMDIVKKEDCLDLPPLVRVTREVELSDEQTKAYKELKKDLVAFIERDHQEPKAIVAQMAVTKALRLYQIVCGSVTADDGSLVTFENTPRTKELESLLEELAPNHKVIVWSIFRADYAAIQKVCEKLGVKYALLTGGQSEKEKQKSVDDFQQDQETRVLIANQASGGVGLNLTAASYSIYYSKDSSHIKDSQSNDRNYRNGSQVHEKITRIDLHASRTVEDNIVEALVGKKNLSDMILTKDFMEKL